MKEQGKILEGLSKVETSSLPSKDFKAMIIKKLNEFGWRMGEHGKMFKRDLQNKKKK